MVNSQLVKEVVDAFKLDLNVEKIPQVVATSESNPKLVREGNLKQSSTAATGAMSLIAAAEYTGKYVYLRSLSLTLAKDATCDVATGLFSITSTIEGVSKSLGSIAMLTLTAQSETQQFVYNPPIRIDKGASVTGTNSFTAGAMLRGAVLVYYVDETS